ncbi:MAG: serine/threonine protein kinase, partial [Planctomycetaceae bacterium]|nr:serine/threonine protein kinase [Planctomycetaceae bacterium]
MPDDIFNNTTKQKFNGAEEQTTMFTVPPASIADPFAAGYLFSGTYRLEKQIGRGGMGIVWKAYDEVADRHVVLKFIPKELLSVKEAVDSVKNSFKKVHALQHQHICPVYGLFNDAQYGLYLVMKYINGVTLSEYKNRMIEKEGTMPFNDAVQIFWATAQGLDYAHEKKVIHRDIKPQNIMISEADGVQIIDFGLAEEIRTSMLRYSQVEMDTVGTRPYMSPEQWQGRYQDDKTDQYALAVTAYELFSGRFPFYSTDTAVLRECVLHDEPDTIAEVPPYVNAVLRKALAKKREERFENCKQFIEAMTNRPADNRFRGAAGVNVLPRVSRFNTQLQNGSGVLVEQKVPSSDSESQSLIVLPPSESGGEAEPKIWKPGIAVHHSS